MHPSPHCKNSCGATLECPILWPKCFDTHHGYDLCCNLQTEWCGSQARCTYHLPTHGIHSTKHTVSLPSLKVASESLRLYAPVRTASARDEHGQDGGRFTPAIVQHKNHTQHQLLLAGQTAKLGLQIARELLKPFCPIWGSSMQCTRSSQRFLGHCSYSLI